MKKIEGSFENFEGPCVRRRLLHLRSVVQKNGCMYVKLGLLLPHPTSKREKPSQIALIFCSPNMTAFSFCV